MSRSYKSGNHQQYSSLDLNNPRHKYSHPASFQSHQESSSMSLMFPILFCLLFTTVLYIAHQQSGTPNQLQQLSNLTSLLVPQQSLPDYSPSDFYWFSVSTKDLIINSNLDNLYRRNRKVYSVDRITHLRAVLLTQLTHNVDWKGQVNVEMAPFDVNMQEKEATIRRVMEMEEKYYDKQYSINKYQHHQLRFCILVPSYNNVKYMLYLRNLDSIFMQDYQNYHVVYVDDKSPDKTGGFVRKYVQEKEIPEEKIKIIINEVNKKAMQNIYEKIHEECPDGEIVGLIDGDDSFNGRQVLKLYNALFHQKKAALIYSNFLKITSNSRTQFGFGSQVTQEYFQAGNLRTYWPIVGTHFMAFYSDIFKLINQSDFCFDNGTYFDYAYDRAIITPLLELSHPRHYYLPEMIYEYRNDTGVNDGSYEWKKVSNIIQDRKAYKNLERFAFVDENQVVLEARREVEGK